MSSFFRSQQYTGNSQMNNRQGPLVSILYLKPLIYLMKRGNKDHAIFISRGISLSKHNTMKTSIHTVQDTLAYQLEGLYFGEKRIADELEKVFSCPSAPRLQEEIRKYARSTSDKLMKLERIFNYLMHEPEPRKNKVVNKLLEDTAEMLGHTDSSHLRNILVVSCLQNINAYKVSALKIAYMFTVELELDAASDLLQQILEWELETGKALSRIAIEEFNNTPGMLEIAG